MVHAVLLAALAASTVVSAKPTQPVRRSYPNASCSSSAATSGNSSISTVHFPLNYKYGGQNKVATAVSVPWANTTIDVVYDQGSENFWLMGPDSIVNWGCQSLACAGKCNASEPAVYDYTKSSASSAHDFETQYMYGMFDKVATGNIAVNDTLTFVNVAGVSSTIPGIEFALEAYLQNRIGISNNTCKAIPDHDVGILGVAPFQTNAMRNTTGPSVRKNLLDRGQIGANVQSIWFDQAPADVEGTYTGGGLMGGIDTSKYTGPLVKVPYLTPKLELLSPTVGYYVAVPQVSVAGTTFNLSTESTSCFLDSGTHVDDLPVPYAETDLFNSLTGTVFDPLGHLAYPANCEDVPADLTIDLTWAGLNPNETVTVKVPLRNYARGNVSPEGYCTLNMSPGGCLLGAPFSTAAFFAADDEREEVALAQGGVAPIGSVPDAASIVERIP